MNRQQHQENMQLITLNELKERIKMSEVWIRRRVNDKVKPMPHYRIGTQLRFYLPKVLDWVDARYSG